LEFIGGLVILFGVFTRIAAILLAINMIGAVLLTLSMGFTNGYELGLLYLSIMITLILTGPGDLSIEKNLLRREIFPKTILNRL
jgi:putative oxidoreductase